MVEVELTAVRVDLQSNTPVVLLQEIDGSKRTLPIFIGTAEATAIAFAIQGVVTERPMTHDLIRDLMDSLGARLEKVTVTELKRRNENEGTYYAELEVWLDQTPHVISSRPSDAIALAARTQSPIFVADELLDEKGVFLQDEEEEENPDELVGKFRQFIEEISPEDFT